ncbi:peroxisomal acyl-coenzyme A oxidase 1-like [Amphiura filiformis]|uniref:peroxisomal acyl-coenzyme A oxidase 1-like n=1 Tax=Amphiura filiformis TaxID=82378 RepID=UPI003B21B159
MASPTTTTASNPSSSLIPSTPNPDIMKERKTASFNTSEMTVFIDGSEQETKHRRQMEAFLLKQKLFSTNANNMSAEEEYDFSAKETVQFIRALKARGGMTIMDAVMKGRRVVTNDFLFGVHDLMFVPTIERLGTEEQQAKWAPLGKEYKILGTYAQTELGHGTYLPGLETTATYDPSTQDFIVDTPKLTSMKFWPGSLGHTANHCILMANLIIKGQNYGPHAFMLQIRSREDHRPLAGITLGDIGTKWTHNGHGNGFLRINKVRIPRNQMLMKYAQVSPDGTYSKQGNIKMMYNTMILVRMTILTYAFIGLSKATTIAIRYSAVRRQGALKMGDPEVQILDYQTQQQKLFPGLATAYAFNSVFKRMYAMYEECNSDIQRGDFSSLPELHGLASGLKSFMTYTSHGFIDQCRQSCGGHGFLLSGGLAGISSKFSASITYEGENSVMILQTARYLMKTLSAIQSGGQVIGSASYLASPPQQHSKISSKSDVLNFDLLMQAFEHRAYRLTMAAGQRLAGFVMQGLSQAEALGNSTIDLTKAAEAHLHYFIVASFCAEVNAVHSSNGIKEVLTTLCQLYAVYGMDRNMGDFLQDGYMNGEQAEMVHEQYLNLLAALRPNAVALVDAFDYRDEALHSVLGCYDGNAYERLFADSLSCAKNKTEVHPIYEKYLKPLMKDTQSKL